MMLMFCFRSHGISHIGGTAPVFSGSCHGLGSERVYISGLLNMLTHPRMVDWVDEIIARRVLIVDIASSYSILVLMIAMITTNIIAPMGELDLGLKWGDILRSK